MPAAVASTQAERKELKSLPGGFVELKRMTYGQKLQRQAETSKMSLRAAAGGKTMEGEIAAMDEKTTLLEFAWCITAHNLTDEQERPLNMSNPFDVKRLDGRVGEEIQTYISNMNNFEEDQTEEGNSSTAVDDQ
jgi:hypothetical protein